MCQYECAYPFRTEITCCRRSSLLYIKMLDVPGNCFVSRSNALFSIVKLTTAFNEHFTSAWSICSSFWCPDSGCAFASAVRPSFLTAEPVVHLRAAPRHIRVRLSGTESGFSPSFYRFALLISILPQRHTHLSPYPRCAVALARRTLSKPRFLCCGLHLSPGTGLVAEYSSSQRPHGLRHEMS